MRKGCFVLQTTVARPPAIPSPVTLGTVRVPGGVWTWHYFEAGKTLGARRFIASEVERRLSSNLPLVPAGLIRSPEETLNAAK